MWYQERTNAGVSLPTGIAYFSMEFGVAEVLPNYSGASASWPVTTSSPRPTWGCR